jgi:two-component system, OmpR family, phosphate regulon sensor histidine kinase PhoR
MGWIAFALVLALLAAGAWYVRRNWILPSRELEEMVGQLATEQRPRTFVIGGAAPLRGMALALEQLVLRDEDLRARVEEGEFGVQAIIGALADGLVVADERRRIRMMNRAFGETFGVDPAATGGTLLEVVWDASVEQSLGEALARGETRQSEIILQRATGVEQYLQVVVAPIKDEQGTVSGAVILFRDVTSRRQTEAMRRDFVANVSHELRTPLSILRGYLETLLENPKQPPADLLRIFEVMERHSNRLNLLVNDVLSLSRLEGPGAALEFTTIRPQIFLRGLLRDWEKKFTSKKLQVALEVPDDLPPLRVDEGRLQEVLYNLLDNAVRYSETGGRIVVRAERAGQDLCLSVTDTGLGIAARDLPRIFERFYRTDQARQRERGGTGLGLSIVKHIAQLHGGSVTAESELGRGTTVRVHLPWGAAES